MKRTIWILTVLTTLACTLRGQTGAVKEHVEKGIALHDKGDYQAAINEYKKALAQDENSPLINYEISSTYFAAKEYEKAVDHCNVVIKQNKEYVNQAYVIKGSALDLAGKPKEAIKAYKKGVSEYPGDHLLYFNLAFTAYNIKDLKESEEALQKGLKLKPTHSSSHLLMSYITSDQGKRVKSVLALYNFLLLEPKGKRALSAFEMLEKQTKKGVRKENAQSTTITLSQDFDSDEFSAAELMLSLLEASKNTEENRSKSEEVMFVENTNSLIAVLGEQMEKNKSSWWNFYVDFFSSMKENGHVEAMCYYIQQSDLSPEAGNWLKNNPEKTKALLKWVSEQERK